MIRSFRTNPRYLEMYHWKMGIGLFAVNCLLLYFTDQTWNDLAYYVPVLFLLVSPQIMVAMTGYACAIGLTLWQGNFDSMSLVEALAALIVTFPVSGLMHSTSHDSMRPRWLNRPVGELMGMFHLVGYPDWKIIHIIHHTYTDDAQLDPHPPGEKSYWEFAKGMRNAAALAYVNYYIRYFGSSELTLKNLKSFSRASKFDNFMRLGFWLLLLKPEAFTFFFSTSLVFKMFHWAWFNWSTHRPVAEGVAIQNHNHGFYRVMNLLAFGLYFHKNHHLQASLFDPRDLKQQVPESSEQLKMTG